MVMESFITPFEASQKPWKMIFLGFLYGSVGVLLALWVFKSYSSMVMVFLTTMAAVPLIYNAIIQEEEKDLMDLEEKFLIKEHSKELWAFFLLFVGFTFAFTFWYVVLPSATVAVLFESQIHTFNTINTGSQITGQAYGFPFFTKVFLNNVKVLIFAILFSFIYGLGAIFILTWNASVIGLALGNFIRGNLAALTGAFGLTHLTAYLAVSSCGILRYAIHGIPEILAYFTAGLAGGIISVAVIRHDFATRKFEHILLDSADLILLSILLLLVAALLETYVTPGVFRTVCSPFV